MIRQPRAIAWLVPLLMASAHASDDVPSLELLELLGQWSELAEYGVDIDSLLADTDESTAPTRPHENEETTP